jgi:hypothetical protein
MYTIPETYKHSRELFINGLTHIKTIWPSASQSSFQVSQEDNLTIDWVSANSINLPKKLFILSTGLHGIEGYIGSIMLQMFIHEFLPRINPDDTGVLFIHCINPSGMQRRYRTNSSNVDLNRNFISDFSKMGGINPEYPKLDKFFNPKSPVGSEGVTKLGFVGKAINKLLRFGYSRVRDAALMGQYLDESGMYFGGNEIQPETGCMMGLFQDWILRYPETLHLDMHSGYGPRFQMTLVQTPSETMTSLEAQERYGITRVAATNPEEFYPIHGEMSDFIYSIAKNTNRKAYSAAFEFGTYGDGSIAGIRSLLTTILGNQILLNKTSSKNLEWVMRDYDELYFPSDPVWLETAIINGRNAFEGILKAERFIL